MEPFFDPYHIVLYTASVPYLHMWDTNKTPLSIERKYFPSVSLFIISFILQSLHITLCSDLSDNHR